MNTFIDVEVILKEYSNNISKKSIIGLIHNHLKQSSIRPNSVINNFENAELSILHKDVDSIIVGDLPGNNKFFVDFNNTRVNWFVYSLDTYGPATQIDVDCEEGETVLSTQLTLPSAYLVNIWENLYYDHDIKENLLRYAQTMMEFSDKGVNCNIISCNRVILLHGPPGTGKTSLCQALAQKLTIRMSERFTSGVLIEINSHSLFSKWYSESGKLVNKMFTKIKEVVEDPNVLVCVLIDEVESIAHARNKCTSGLEPSDSIRVVNALLTQIDRIKRHSNVLLFTTSNMTETIDLAFVDRADIKQFLGMPMVPAIYKIYRSCIDELIKAQIIKGQLLDSAESIENNEIGDTFGTKAHLLKVCEKSVGLSGRSLRKIPFIAHALFLEKSSLPHLNEFFQAMEKAVEKELIERKYFSGFKNQGL